MEKVDIGGRRVGSGESCMIVAELSANHRQDLRQARAIVRAAARCGADAVKTQTYRPDTMTLPLRMGRFLHQEAGSLWAGRSLYEIYESGYMPWEWQRDLKSLAEDLGLIYFSSAYDRSSVDFLDQLDVPAIKIASFELVDLPLIEHAASTGRTLILSTGAATVEEIAEAVNVARCQKARGMVLLKCTSSYPTAPEDLNLRGVRELTDRFRMPAGFSDHSRGIDSAVLAVGAGACMVEKHFSASTKETLDSEFSLDTRSFRRMVATIRKAEKMLGSPRLGPLECERESLGFRRSLYAVEDIAAGEILTEKNIRSIRPSGGLAPKYLPKLLGRKVSRFIPQGHPLTEEDIEDS